MAESSATEKRIPRPPVVVVMGHIDHGKTTLLDYVRKSNVAARESGGITQHIGAYEITHGGRRITFLDTPGHEVFSKMRSRGAKVADAAILVVAADDGVKPQTLEALSAIQEAKIPFVVALNKIDKPNANADRVKTELLEHGVMVEGWGGTIPVAEISARSGQGVDQLLELVLLSADLEELTGNPDAPATGVVIESHLDSRRGATATLLIKDGTLSKGNFVACRDSIAPVKTLESVGGEALSDATFSTPVVVLGFTKVPGVGETFFSYKDKESAERSLKETGEAREDTRGRAAMTQEEAGSLFVPVVLKADVEGSREAIEEEFAKLMFPEIRIRIIKSGVGDVTDDDIKSLSSHKGGVVIGFKTKVAVSAKSVAERFGVAIQTFDVIYEAIDWLKKEMEARLPAEVKKIEEGKLRVAKVFKKIRERYVFGGKVSSGILKKGVKFDVFRGVEVKGGGKIANLQKNKLDVDEVKEGFECGISADVAGDLIEGDTVLAYSEEVIKKELKK